MEHKAEYKICKVDAELKSKVSLRLVYCLVRARLVYCLVRPRVANRLSQRSVIELVGRLKIAACEQNNREREGSKAPKLRYTNNYITV